MIIVNMKEVIKNEECLISGWSQLPMNAKYFLERKRIRVVSCERLAGESKPVYKIVTEDGALVLKHNPKGSGLMARFRRLIFGSLGFDREIQFYQNASKAQCADYIAGYVASDPNNLLIELLPTKKGRAWAPRGQEWVVLANGLLSLHWKSGINDSGFRAFVHRSIYGPVGVALRIGFPCVRAEFGWWLALRYVMKLLNCIWKQPRLSRRHLCHNDFLPNNILFSEDSSEVFFIDFQDVTMSSRWPLFDLMRISWHIEISGDNGFDNEFIQAYIDGMDSDVRESLNFHAQVEFGLLICLVHSFRWRKLHGGDRSELTNSLLRLIVGDGANPVYLKIKNQLADSLCQKYKECKK